MHPFVHPPLIRRCSAALFFVVLKVRLLSSFRSPTFVHPPLIRRCSAALFLLPSPPPSLSMSVVSVCGIFTAFVWTLLPVSMLIGWCSFVGLYILCFGLIWLLVKPLNCT